MFWKILINIIIWYKHKQQNLNYTHLHKQPSLLSTRKNLEQPWYNMLDSKISLFGISKFYQKTNKYKIENILPYFGALLGGVVLCTGAWLFDGLTTVETGVLDGVFVVELLVLLIFFPLLWFEVDILLKYRLSQKTLPKLPISNSNLMSLTILTIWTHFEHFCLWFFLGLIISTGTHFSLHARYYK